MDHTAYIDAAAATYLASAPLAVFEDPDGDPLDAGGSTGDESCDAFSFMLAL